MGSQEWPEQEPGMRGEHGRGGAVAGEVGVKVRGVWWVCGA